MKKAAATSTMPNKELKIISQELSRLANEIEELPHCDCGNISKEQIIRMQQIDLCSQRLQDLSALTSLMSVGSENCNSVFLSKRARLEYTRELFRNC